MTAQKADELFDVVDEVDRVVGQATRGDVHARGLRHRAVHVLVFNARREVFLQRRSAAKDTFPGRWDSSCSGHLDAGEAYLAAGLRELQEEIGLAVSNPALLEPLFKVSARPETGMEFIWLYRLQHEGPFQLHPAEIDEGAFFAPAWIDHRIEFNPDDFAGPFRFLWPIFRRQFVL